VSVSRIATMRDVDRVLPDSIGRYRIACELGQGGMAVLYLATATGPGGFERFFAIKMIHEHLCRDEAFVGMFLNEARIAARIRHPNVIPVFDVDIDRGRYFIAMEYVSGETLAQSLLEAWSNGAQGEAITYRIAAGILTSVAEGLHIAHELRSADGTPLDVVHRDVSPRNIMVGYDGVPRLMDFGVAKAGDQLNHSRPGTVKGTLAYVAPEYLKGESVDRRADLFSLGAVLWETTVGKRLFWSRNDLDTGARVLKLPVPRPSEFRPDYPPALEAIVMRALERDNKKRYPTARQLADDLQAFVATTGGHVTSREVEAFMKSLFAQRYAQRLDMEQKAAAKSPDARFALAPTHSSEIGLALLTLPSSVEVDLGLEFRGEESSPRARQGHGWITKTALAVGTAAIGGALYFMIHASGEPQTTPIPTGTPIEAPITAPAAPPVVDPPKALPEPQKIAGPAVRKEHAPVRGKRTSAPRTSKRTESQKPGAKKPIDENQPLLIPGSDL
jgi:serine/threonine-protein kinase